MGWPQTPFRRPPAACQNAAMGHESLEDKIVMADSPDTEILARAASNCVICAL
jgi:hypothetical protein